MYLSPVLRVPKYWTNILPPSTYFKSEDEGNLSLPFHDATKLNINSDENTAVRGVAVVRTYVTLECT
jgi:hypothetical protein